MNKRISLAFLLIVGLNTFAEGQTLKSISVGQIFTNRALIASKGQSGEGLSLDQVCQSLRSQTQSALQSTGKFEVLEEEHAGDLFERAQTQQSSGDFDTKTAPKVGKIKAAQYVVHITINQFLDNEVRAKLADFSNAYKRRFQIGGTFTLEDTTTGSNLVSKTIFVETNDAIVLRSGDVFEPRQTERVLQILTEQFGSNVATTTIDRIFPLKVLSVHDGVVTLNRGGLKDGVNYTVFAPPTTETDPDSGQIISVPGKEIGHIKIKGSDTIPSQSEIVDETEKGKIQKGCIVH